MHSIDETQNLMTEWTKNAKPVYESVNYRHDDDHNATREESPFEMTDDWYLKQAQLKQEGLDRARELDVHYLMVRYHH